MTVATEVDLCERAMLTVLACWEENTRGANGASLERGPGVAAAIFPAGPERVVYNNAVLDRGLPADERIDALDAMAALYAAAGIDDYRAWVHETDRAMRADLERWGYRLAETTRAMGMALDDLDAARPDIELGPPDWDEYLRLVGVAPDFLRGADHSAFHIVVARSDGENVATGMAYDAADDCGIYNVGTVEHARRRGLRHRADGNAPARCARPRAAHGDAPIDPDGRARVCRGRVPRPRADPRVRAARRALTRSAAVVAGQRAGRDRVLLDRLAHVVR